MKCAIACLLAFSLVPAYAQDAPRAKGAEFLSAEEYGRIQVAPMPVSGKLPDSVSLEGYFPAPRTQGKLGSCTAWAATYCKAYRIYLASGLKGDPNDYLQSPAFVYSALTRQKCNVGTPIVSALQLFKILGSISWDELPYSDTECPDWQRLRSKARNNSYAAYRLDGDGDVLLGRIRNHLVGGDPVVVAIDACGEFDWPRGGVITSVSGPASACGGHAVVIVGYDDKLKAVRILNSWGEKWGDSGKVWMSYSVLRQRLREAYVDYGPGGANTEDLAWLLDGSTPVSAPRVAVVSAALLRDSIRSNIDPKILRSYGNASGEQIDVSIWSIWLNLPAEYASQVKFVGYYFDHPTFKHNPQRSLPNSSVFLAEWRGYGCVTNAWLVAHLKDGRDVRADFDFCAVTLAQRPK
ncbi:MAG: C1 family peptidase [Vicinamibacteria bacterium]